MIWYFTELTEYLKIRRINPGFHFIDNEASTYLKMTITTMGIKYQLFPPSNHIETNAEREIQTFKNHFIAGQCSIYKDPQLQLWDRLIQQETNSIKFLRQSRIHPHLSVYNHIFGEFDYNCTPIIPQGERIVIHNSPNYISSWEPHGEDFCYTGL